MEVISTSIHEVKLVVPTRYTDERGWFAETYSDKALAAKGISAQFIQDNHSYSRAKGTVRGLHYQAPPYAQAKLVRVIRGSILDVAVDARVGSPTFGEWVAAELSAESGHQLFVPRGFLHGFITLEPNVEVTYKVDAYYNGAADGSVLWNDGDLGIEWGEAAHAPVLSDKDQEAPGWRNFVSPFEYEAAS